MSIDVVPRRVGLAAVMLLTLFTASCSRSPTATPEGLVLTTLPAATQPGGSPSAPGSDTAKALRLYAVVNTLVEVGFGTDDEVGTIAWNASQLGLQATTAEGLLREGCGKGEAWTEPLPAPQMFQFRFVDDPSVVFDSLNSYWLKSRLVAAQGEKNAAEVGAVDQCREISPELRAQVNSEGYQQAVAEYGRLYQEFVAAVTGDYLTVQRQNDVWSACMKVKGYVAAQPPELYLRFAELAAEALKDPATEVADLELLARRIATGKSDSVACFGGQDAFDAYVDAYRQAVLTDLAPFEAQFRAQLAQLPTGALL
jgi:hypothetical protein